MVAVTDCEAGNLDLHNQPRLQMVGLRHAAGPASRETHVQHQDRAASGLAHHLSAADGRRHLCTQVYNTSHMSLVCTDVRQLAQH